MGRGGRQFESGHPDKAFAIAEAFFMMFKVYILYSDSLEKFYTGFTSDIEQRLLLHNEGKNHFSKKGIPWRLIKYFDIELKSEALKLEKQIKKNGSKRYLERNNIEYSI